LQQEITMRVIRTSTAGLMVIMLAACAANGPPPGSVQRLSPEELARIRPVAKPVVGLEEIIARTKTGATPEAIIARLAETGTVHVLSSAQIIELSRQGVDQKVIDYLAETQEKARQATLTTQLADRDAQAAAQLEQERQRRLALQHQYDSWYWGGYSYGPWGPRYGIGWGRGSYADPFFRPWRRW
jgi:hypothetical protein